MDTATDFKDTLKMQADIVRIVGDYVRLKKSGAQNYSGLCPFHNEKTPSFSVHATRQFYHCFGCGASGDVFSFVQKIENISFPETVRLVAQKVGVALPKLTYSSPQEAWEAQQRTALLEIHEKACNFFQDYLRRPEGAVARQYLVARGLDEETVVRFRIGYAPDSGSILRETLKGRFDEDLLRASGLFSWKEQQALQAPQDEKSGYKKAGDGESKGMAESLSKTGEPLSKHVEPRPTLVAMYAKFRNRIMFPIANDAGRVIGFTGRTLSTDEKAGPKYLNSPETPIYSKSRVLFNLDQAKEAIRKLDYAILVEGQMDCISVFAAGFRNVIATSGTAFTDPQAKLLGRFTKNVVVNFDPDTAGAKATERTLSLLVGEDFHLKVLRLEPGLDPDLYVRRKGKAAYLEALKHSQGYFDYLIERAKAVFATRTGEGKVKALNYLLPHIQRVPSRIVRDELAHEIAQKVGIDSAVLRQELKHVAANRSAATVKAPAEIQITDAEKLLIRALVSAGEMQAGEEHLSARDGAEEGFDPSRQARFVLKSERLHEGLPAESLLEALLQVEGEVGDVMLLPIGESDRRLLASILLREEEELSPERLEGAVRALRRKALRRKLEFVQVEIERNQGKEPGRTQALLAEKMRIKRALMDPVLSDTTSLPAL